MVLYYDYTKKGKAYMSFNKKVLKLLKEKKKTKAELAKAAGIPYTTLDSMLKRESDTSRLTTIYKIAEFLEVSFEELVFDKPMLSVKNDDFSEEEKNLILDFRRIDARGRDTVLSALSHEVSLTRRKDAFKLNTSKRSLPVYNAPAAAGAALPMIADDYTLMETDDAPLDADFGIIISGDSMEPTIFDGSIAWVKRQDNLNDGEIGIFILNGESLCKKYDVSNGTYSLVSVNKKYHPIEILESDDLRFVGKVVF